MANDATRVRTRTDGAQEVVPDLDPGTSKAPTALGTAMTAYADGAHGLAVAADMAALQAKLQTVCNILVAHGLATEP